MTDLIKAEPRDIDGFQGFDDGVEDNEQAQSRGVIQGACAKFTNEARWELRDGEELASDLELVVIDIGRVVQRWENQQPIETRVLEPGQKFPDINKLNDEVPRDEWTEGPDGKPRGPWQAQHLVYLLNPATMDRYTFPTGTVGGSIAVRELVDKTNWMRKFRGTRVYPVVTLSDTFMKTRFGGRQRPHFLIKRWVGLGPTEEKALPAPSSSPPMTTQQQLEQSKKPDEKPVTAQTTQAALPTVEEPTLAEELNDAIPTFDGDESKTGKNAAPRPTARRDLKKPPAKGSAKATSKRRLSNFDAG